jgi:hypothetical protein
MQAENCEPISQKRGWRDRAWGIGILGFFLLKYFCDQNPVAADLFRRTTFALMVVLLFGFLWWLPRELVWPASRVVRGFVATMALGFATLTGNGIFGSGRDPEWGVLAAFLIVPVLMVFLFLRGIYLMKWQDAEKRGLPPGPFAIRSTSLWVAAVAVLCVVIAVVRSVWLLLVVPLLLLYAWPRFRPKR